MATITKEKKNTITMPAEAQAFEWNGQTYNPGQEFDVTGWNPQEIKNFRDQTGSTFYADDITDQFEQYSLDNLGGMSQYDFQWNGNQDQWSQMMASPEMNRFYQAYGVNEGDVNAGMDVYNYYDGTQYDEAGNIVQQGTGVNDINSVDPFNNYTDMENIVGGDVNAFNNFVRGYHEDAEDFGDGTFGLDGRQSTQLSDAEAADRSMQAYQAFNVDAKNQGKINYPSEPEVKDPMENPYDVIYNPFPITPGSPGDGATLGTVQDQPTIDPDITPREMWSPEDVMALADAYSVPMVNEAGEEIGSGGMRNIYNGEEMINTWDAVQGPVEGGKAFPYTEGALDNPFQVSRESFESATSLLGPDMQYVSLIDEYGNPTQHGYDPSQANVTPPGGGPIENYVSEAGTVNFGQDDLFGLYPAIPRTYKDEFIDEQMKEGGVLSGPAGPGWTPTIELAAKYGWNAEDLRAFAEYYEAASHNYSSGTVSPKEESRAIQFVNDQKWQRENAPAFTFPYEDRYNQANSDKTLS